MQPNLLLQFFETEAFGFFLMGLGPAHKDILHNVPEYVSLHPILQRYTEYLCVLADYQNALKDSSDSADADAFLDSVIAYFQCDVEPFRQPFPHENAIFFLSKELFNLWKRNQDASKCILGSEKFSNCVVPQLERAVLQALSADDFNLTTRSSILRFIGRFSVYKGSCEALDSCMVKVISCINDRPRFVRKLSATHAMQLLVLARSFDVASRDNIVESAAHSTNTILGASSIRDGWSFRQKNIYKVQLRNGECAELKLGAKALADEGFPSFNYWIEYQGSADLKLTDDIDCEDDPANLLTLYDRRHEEFTLGHYKDFFEKLSNVHVGTREEKASYSLESLEMLKRDRKFKMATSHILGSWSTRGRQFDGHDDLWDLSLVLQHLHRLDVKYKQHILKDVVRKMKERYVARAVERLGLTLTSHPSSFFKLRFLGEVVKNHRLHERINKTREAWTKHVGGYINLTWLLAVHPGGAYNIRGGLLKFWNTFVRRIADGTADYRTFRNSHSQPVLVQMYELDTLAKFDQIIDREYTNIGKMASLPPECRAFCEEVVTRNYVYQLEKTQQARARERAVEEISTLLTSLNFENEANACLAADGFTTRGGMVPRFTCPGSVFNIDIAHTTSSSKKIAIFYEDEIMQAYAQRFKFDAIDPETGKRVLIDGKVKDADYYLMYADKDDEDDDGRGGADSSGGKKGEVDEEEGETGDFVPFSRKTETGEIIPYSRHYDEIGVVSSTRCETLEALGWTCVQIPQHEWLVLADDEEKMDYLEEKIKEETGIHLKMSLKSIFGNLI